MDNSLKSNKVFSKIGNVRKYISDNGLAIQTLYNSQHGVLVHEGRPVPNAIFSLPIYTYVDSTQEKFSYNKNEIPNPIGTKFKDSRRYLEMKNDAINITGQKTFELYEDIMHNMDEVICKDCFTPENFDKTREVIDLVFDNDRTNLHKCVSMMRTKDNYTFDHSISVFLLFSEALMDFRKLNSESAFFETFKQRNSNINFNLNSIKRYSMGALLHDYGKILIDNEILNKPDLLTDNEFELIKQHPVRGVEELQIAGMYDSDVLELVGNHHPAYKTFENEHVAPLTQILNIIDIYDACRSNRSYKEKFTTSMTLQVLGEEMRKWDWDFFIFSNLLKVTFTRFEKTRSKLRF